MPSKYRKLTVGCEDEDLHQQRSSMRASWKAVKEFKVPASFDFLKPTQQNYDVTPASAQYGPFAAIRRTLDSSYHGCYSKERQALQDTWITDIVQGGTHHDDPWIIYTAGAMGAGKGYAIQWMSRQGHFPLPDIVQVDPDAIRENESEWPEYLRLNPSTAGYLTHREAGYCVEIATEAAMQEHKNVWVDGSLRDSCWYKEVFAKIRRDHPHYRIAILHVSASWETVKARAESRALKTGRVVPEADLRTSFEQVPASVSALSPLADFCAHIDNEGTPTLSQTCQAGECESNATGTWEEVRNRFAAIRKLPLQA